MPFNPPRVVIFPGNQDVPLVWDPVARQHRPAEELIEGSNWSLRRYDAEIFPDEDVRAFIRRNPDYVRSAGKALDTYIQNNNLPKNLQSLEIGWAAIKDSWNAEAEATQRHIEGVILKGLVQENRTAMLIDGMEVDRCE